MKFRGYIYLAVTILIFSTLEVVSSALKGVMDPLHLTFLRFLIGGLVLLPILIFKREKVKTKDLLFFWGLGILNILISMGSLQLAVSYGKASTAAILVSSNPVFVALFSMIILKEKITKNRVMCILLGIIGIFLIIYKGNSGGDTLLGIAFAVVASMTFGLYTVLARFKAENISSISMICISALLGSISYIPVLLLRGVNPFHIPHGTLLRVLYLGIVLSGIAYITYMEALKILTASKGSMVFFLKPVIASILAIMILGEKVEAKTIVGAALVLLGLLINFARLENLYKLFVNRRDTPIKG